MRLQDWLAVQVDARPEASAIRWEGETQTFGDLELRSNRIAHLLREQGCRHGDRVAFSLPKSPDAYAVMLGTLKADGVYVPLDPGGPASRLARILSATEPACVVATSEQVPMIREALGLAGLLERTRLGVLGTAMPAGPIAFHGGSLEEMPDGLAPSRAKGSDPAHLLFTSGSTGAPKGVVITHDMVIAFVEWANAYFGLGPDDRISGHAPLTFDLSTFDTFGTLASGAELHPVPPAYNLLAPKLAAFIRDRALTQWFSVPSVLTYLEAFDAVPEDGFPALRRLLWCGEVLPTPTLSYLMRRLPAVRFTNLYGPTETTIASSFHTISEPPLDLSEPVPIGRACGGEALYALDDELRPCAPEVVGELYIAGAGLSPGYWRDPAKTGEVFVDGPFEHIEAARIYKTGDLARMDIEGDFHFHGRADTQIKSRGYRIELGEIEAALATLDDLAEAAVVAVPGHGLEGSLICCAFVRAPGSAADGSDLKPHLGRLLPRYMIPTRWLSMDALPRTPNGKVDRPMLKRRFAEDTQHG